MREAPELQTQEIIRLVTKTKKNLNMYISKIHISNLKSFRGAHTIEFSKGVNVLIGKNNTGKSTIIESVLSLQYPTNLQPSIGLSSYKVQIDFKEFDPNTFGFSTNLIDQSPVFFLRELERPSVFIYRGHQIHSLSPSSTALKAVEPHNFIYPYLSKRKVVNYSEDIKLGNAFSVRNDLSNLFSKVDRLINPYYLPGHRLYIDACNKIIGFPISTLASSGGKKAVWIIYNNEHIPITAMGEGVPNLLGLIVDLCIAEDKLFLIEELENDIHPEALKALLNLIAEKSINNQFIISTHSNIVAKYLGALPDTKIFQTEMSFSEGDRPYPMSTVKEVPNQKETRWKVLEDLGYEFYDYNLWKGWLFFEESSAEEIVREYLIPWFVPSLKDTLRTFACQGFKNTELKFRDFNNLFVFLHLEPQYKNKAWVILDAGDDEEKVLSNFKQTYSKSGWNEDNFIQLCNHDFEKYYPNEFRDKVDSILKMQNKEERKNAKSKLLNEVKSWIDDNPKEAKKAFQKSAKEVIGILRKIESNLNI